MQIIDVKIKAPHDPDPQFDHLGEYSDEPGPEDRTIDRGNVAGKRYFVAEDAGAAEELYQRMDKFARGHLSMYGVRAVATVRVDGVRQTIKSPCVWGIPSDAGPEYASLLAEDELSTLVKILDGLGFDTESVDGAEWVDQAPWSETVSLS